MSDDARRKSEKRKQDRDLRISRVAEPNRRRDCLADIYQFLPTYFPDVFYQPFTVDRREMIDAIIHAARFGGDQAVAGPRADGKTRSAIFCALALVLAGHVTFPMIISKSGPRAARELKNLKQGIEGTIRDQTPFALDFPEICEPIQKLDRWASKARQQTAYGVFTEMEWGEECIIFPTISTALLRANGWHDDIDSAARGQIVASLGIEGPIRGYSVRNRRPDVVLLDDIDDRESARSEMQTETREKIIEEDIGGLAGPDKTVARVMLCTLINQTCIAAKFTDRKQKPSWRGQRHRLLLEKPKNESYWEEYIRLRKERDENDPDARVAHRHYLAHRAEMDAGAIVTNPYRFDSRLLPDGEPVEVSALQACYNLVADRGWEHFNTEYQNDPPEESGRVESGITPQLVRKQISGFACGVIPEGCTVLVHACDVGKTKGFHWVVRAYKQDGTVYTIDYGIMDVIGAKYGSDEGLDRAIFAAVKRREEEFRAAGYGFSNGATISDPVSIYDSRYRTDAVMRAVKELGMGVYAIKGIGQSAGAAIRGKYRPCTQATATRKPGRGERFYYDRDNDFKLWALHADTDYWKAWEHDRWMTARDKPGCAFLWGTEDTSEHQHDQYAKHICSEVETEEEHKGVMRRVWIPKSKEMDWLDASYYADVGAAMKGVRVLAAGESQKAIKPRQSLGQLRKQASLA
jgi:hypothetical protein